MNDLEHLFDDWLAFLKREGLPIDLDAQEAILLDLTDNQKTFVKDFIQRWEALW